MMATYLRGERDLGRVAPDAEVDTLAPTLIGKVHLLFTDWGGEPVAADAVDKVVISVVPGMWPQPAA